MVNRWTLRRQERAEADMAGLSAHAAPGSAAADRRDMLKLIREAVELLELAHADLKVGGIDFTPTFKGIRAFLARWRGKP